jgi:hypothetical protein
MPIKKPDTNQCIGLSINFRNDYFLSPLQLFAAPPLLQQDFAAGVAPPFINKSK